MQNSDRSGDVGSGGVEFGVTDLETFVFRKDGALVPRPIAGLVDDLQRHPTFEKILCYQYPGLMNAPWVSIKPGGEATVKLYQDYKRYLEGLAK